MNYRDGTNMLKTPNRTEEQVKSGETLKKVVSAAPEQAKKGNISNTGSAKGTGEAKNKQDYGKKRFNTPGIPLTKQKDKEGNTEGPAEGHKGYVI